MNSTPTDVRLLQGVRLALNSLANKCEGPEAAQMVVSANILLDELTLRSESGFYADYLARGMRLLAEVEPSNPLHGGNASCASGAIHEQIERLRGCLETASARLTAEGLTKNRAPLEKVLAWEIEFYDRSAQFKASSVPSIDEPLTQEMLQAYLRRRFPHRPPMRVADFKPLIGGLQKLTIVFDS
jgi:hypothetical protein